MIFVFSDQNTTHTYLNRLHDLCRKRPGVAEGRNLSDFICQAEDLTCDVHDEGCIFAEGLGGFGGWPQAGAIWVFKSAVLCIARTQYAMCPAQRVVNPSSGFTRSVNGKASRLSEALKLIDAEAKLIG